MEGGRESLVGGRIERKSRGRKGWREDCDMEDERRGGRKIGVLSTCIGKILNPYKQPLYTLTYTFSDMLVRWGAMLFFLYKKCIVAPKRLANIALWVGQLRRATENSLVLSYDTSDVTLD